MSKRKDKNRKPNKKKNRNTNIYAQSVSIYNNYAKALEKCLGYKKTSSFEIEVGDVVRLNVPHILERKDKLSETYLEFVKGNKDAMFFVEENIHNSGVYKLVDCLWTFHISDLSLIQKGKDMEVITGEVKTDEVQ